MASCMVLRAHVRPSQGSGEGGERRRKGSHICKHFVNTETDIINKIDKVLVGAEAENARRDELLKRREKLVAG